MRDQLSGDIRAIWTGTVREHQRVLEESGESLGPSELDAINGETSNRIDVLLREKSKTINGVQSCLAGVKGAVVAIDTVFSRAVEIIHGHSGRLTKARIHVSVALEKMLKINDVKLNVNSARDEIIITKSRSGHYAVNVLKRPCVDDRRTFQRGFGRVGSRVR